MTSLAPDTGIQVTAKRSTFDPPQIFQHLPHCDAEISRACWAEAKLASRHTCGYSSFYYGSDPAIPFKSKSD